MHLVTSIRFRSRGKEVGYSIRAAVPENPMLPVKRYGSAFDRTGVIADGRRTLICSILEFTETAVGLFEVLDGQLSMFRQVAVVCRSCFYQIRQLKSVHSLIQAFVHWVGLLQLCSCWSR